MKKVIWVLIVVAIGGAAYWLFAGDKLQNYYEESEDQDTSPMREEKYKLLVGKRFPSVELVTTDGKESGTFELLKSGGVVLFLEPGCNLCEAMIDKWNGLIEKRTVGADEVVGITFMRPAEAEAYRSGRRMDFSLYCDTMGIFLNNHDVTEFPLQVVVGKSGAIYEHTIDIGRQIFPDQLRNWLQN